MHTALDLGCFFVTRNFKFMGHCLYNLSRNMKKLNKIQLQGDRCFSYEPMMRLLYLGSGAEHLTLTSKVRENFSLISMFLQFFVFKVDPCTVIIPYGFL